MSKTKGQQAPSTLNPNSLVLKKPKLVKEWDRRKNKGLLPEDFTIGSHRKVWWRCPAHKHSYKAEIKSRCHNTGCPYCANIKVLTGFNDFATTKPEYVHLWHPTKNGDLTPETVIAGSDKKFWFLCPSGHEWQAQLKSVTSGSGCPKCSGREVITGETDLATVTPALAAEWHPTKNGLVTPSDVTKSTNTLYWWLCPKCGHEWEASVNNRDKGRGCPICNARWPQKTEESETKDLRLIPFERLKQMSEEAFSVYYAEATKPCGVDHQPGQKFPELEAATNRLNLINDEIERRLALQEKEREGNE